jgi:hypothetical protein
VAILVAVLVLDTKLYSPSPSVVEITIPVSVSAIPISAFIITVAFVVHFPISTYSAIVAVVSVAAHRAVSLVVALVRSPIAADLNFLAALLLLTARLFRLLRGALRLNRAGLGLVGIRRRSDLLGE